MLFLDVDLANPHVLPPDSLKEVGQNLLMQVQSDPSTFWQNMLHSAIHFGLKVLAALLIYIVGAWLIRRLKRLLHRIFLRHKTERTLASFVTSFTSIMLTIVLIIVSVSTLGVDTTSLAALLAAGGMAIGMALSGTVQNFAGGIMLLVFKPFRAGEVIEAQGYIGTVMEVSIVSTKILTPDNRVIVLPNGALANGNINNISAQPLRRVDVEVSVAYGSDAAKCIEALQEIITTDPRVLTSKDERPKSASTSAVKLDGTPIPDPFVALLSLNSNDITFVTRSWVRSENYWDVYFGLQKAFYTELPKRGFEFAYPHCDVTLLNQTK